MEFKFIYNLVSDNLFRLKYAEYSRVKQMSIWLQSTCIAAHLLKNNIDENDLCKVRHRPIYETNKGFYYTMLCNNGILVE